MGVIFLAALACSEAVPALLCTASRLAHCAHAPVFGQWRSAYLRKHLPWMTIPAGDSWIGDLYQCQWRHIILCKARAVVGRTSLFHFDPWCIPATWWALGHLTIMDPLNLGDGFRIIHGILRWLYSMCILFIGLWDDLTHEQLSPLGPSPCLNCSAWLFRCLLPFSPSCLQWFLFLYIRLLHTTGMIYRWFTMNYNEFFCDKMYVVYLLLLL